MENEHVRYKIIHPLEQSLKEILKAEDLKDIEITVSIKFKGSAEEKRKKVEEEETLEWGKKQDADRRFEALWFAHKKGLKFKTQLADPHNPLDHDGVPRSIFKEEKRKLRERFDEGEIG